MLLIARDMTNIITKDNAQIMLEIKQLISDGKVVSITAKGYSMNPFIRHLKDSICVGPWKDEDLKKGAAVLAFTTCGKYVFHRIIKRDEDMLTLEGDGNLVVKENATTDNVIGIMYSITRNGRIYTSESLCWKTYSWFWMRLRPFRRYILGVWRRVARQKP